jgi:hypothetical protein
MTAGKRRTNSNVIDAWTKGVVAHNHRGSLSTDGKSLYSYGLKIGHNTGSACVVVDYTAASKNFQSQTTSCHVNLAKRATHPDLVWHPLVWQESPLADQYPF